jgi:hypothetical protein
VGNGADSGGLEGAPADPGISIADLDLSAINGMAMEQLYEKEGFVVENDVLTGYTGKKRSIVIPGSIVEIYDGAFENNDLITIVEIQEGVRIIGKRAFANCGSLIKISIPASVERICDGAFEGGELETLILPKPDVDMVKHWLSDEARKHFHEDDLAEYVSKAGNKVSVNVREIDKTMPKRIACALQKQIEQGTLSFGSYYQMNDKTKEPIEWIVLEKKENRVLLLSKYVLDVRQYHSHSGGGGTHVAWESSDLRKWMNGKFFESILDAMERKLVSPQGDRVFCLKKAEAEKYFPSYEDRKGVSTAYAIDQGATRAYIWCLSSTEYYSSGNCYVIHGVAENGDCGIYYFGSKLGIRPAMWITLDP